MSDVFGLLNRLPGCLLSSPLSPSLSTHFTTNRQDSLPLFAQCIDPSRGSETHPDSTWSVVIVGSGSSPNIYKTSPFC